MAEVKPKAVVGKDPEPRDPIIIDLGRHKRRRVRRLRRGRGRLMGRVLDAVEDLGEDGAIDPNANTVIVIVRQKRRKGKNWFF